MRTSFLCTGAALLMGVPSFAAFAAGERPTIKNVLMDSQVIHRENDIFEEDDFQTVFSATVLPAKGHPNLDPEKIKVYFQGVLVEAGKRSYDPKSGRFLLTLTSQETMKLMNAALQFERGKSGKGASHVVRISVTDESGIEANGTFSPPIDDVKIESRFSVGYSDPYGRFVARDDSANAPPPRAVGKWINLTGPEPPRKAPLDLRMVKRFPVQPPIEPGGNTRVVLTPATGGTVDFTFDANDQAFLATLTPGTGQVIKTLALMAAPKGTVQLARRSEGRLDMLSWRAAGRGVVEALTTHQRVVLEGEPVLFGRGGGALDFLSDAKKIVYAVSGIDLTVKACDWNGNARWQADSTTLFPSIVADNTHSTVSLTALSDGEILVFQSGSDRAQDDDPQFVAISRLSGDHGVVQNSRLVYIPKLDGETRIVNGGTALRFAGRDLIVLNSDRLVGQMFEEETLVLDTAQDGWKPIIKLTSPGDGRFGVYGAAIVGDQLLVGCGTGGAALLRLDAP